MTNLLAEPTARAGRSRPPDRTEFAGRIDRGRPRPPSRPAARARLRALSSVLAGPVCQRLAVGTGLFAVLVVTVCALPKGPLPKNRPLTWWFSLPGDLDGWATGMRAFSDAFYAGLALLTLVWLVLGVGVRAGRWSVRGLWMVGALWALPLTLAPVALSTDLYSYLAQGLLAHDGLSPFVYGPAATDLPAGVERGMSSVWLTTPAPYGPVFVGIAETIAPLAQENLILALLAMRLVAVAGLVLIAVSLPKLARGLGADPVRATWLGVVSPLVLGSFVLSGHNDALMLGLMVAGLAVATGDRRIVGVPPALVAIGLCALAAMVKAPAAAAVVFVAVAWAWRRPDLRSRAARLAASALVTLGVAATASVGTGAGWGWFSTHVLTTPTLASTPFTPTTSIAATVEWVTDAVGLVVPASSIVPALRLAGMALAGALGLALLVRHQRIGTVRALGLTLLAAALAGPVTWPWYITWGLVLLAAAMPARRVLGLIALAGVPMLLIESDGSVRQLGPVTTAFFAAASLALVCYTAYWSYHHLLRSPWRDLVPAVPPSGTRSEQPVGSGVS